MRLRGRRGAGRKTGRGVRSLRQQKMASHNSTVARHFLFAHSLRDDVRDTAIVAVVRRRLSGVVLHARASQPYSRNPRTKYSLTNPVSVSIVYSRLRMASFCQAYSTNARDNPTASWERRGRVDNATVYLERAGSKRVPVNSARIRCDTYHSYQTTSINHRH